MRKPVKLPMRTHLIFEFGQVIQEVGNDELIDLRRWVQFQYCNRMLLTFHDFGENPLEVATEFMKDFLDNVEIVEENELQVIKTTKPKSFIQKLLDIFNFS